MVWATGFRPDYSWLQIPGVLDNGRIIHRRGVTDVPGCASSAKPGNTPADRRCSASSSTTPHTSPTSSRPGTGYRSQGEKPAYQ